MSTFKRLCSSRDSLVSVMFSYAECLGFQFLVGIQTFLPAIVFKPALLSTCHVGSRDCGSLAGIEWPDHEAGHQHLSR
jgi:hypothetical protein